MILALELVLLISSLAIYVVARDQPAEFVGLDTRLDALYFSMVTLTTVGYGDVSAHGQLARGLVTCQLAFDLVFVGALVGLFQARLQERPVDTERAADVGHPGSPSEAGEASAT